MAFHRLERDAWQDPAVARAYAHGFPPVTGHVAEPLLDAVGAGPGELLADLACGPGTVGRRAAVRGSRVVGLDISRAMLLLAEQGPHPLTGVQGSALQLPFADGRFDVAVCNFGLLHFSEPEIALTQGVRILRAGGRAGWSVWGEDALAFRIIPQALEALGFDPRLPSGPAYFRFGATDRFAAGLEVAGLTSIAVRKLAWNAEFPDAEAFWRAFEEGTARTRASIRSLSPAQRASLRTEVDRRLADFATGEVLSVPTTALVAAGVRPDVVVGSPPGDAQSRRGSVVGARR